jgi:hypothetical protein
VANDDLESTVREWPVKLEDYNRILTRERRYHNDEPSSDSYFARVGNWLNLPESDPVEFCNSCSELIDSIGEESIWPVEIPVPYQYRVMDPGEISEGMGKRPYPDSFSAIHGYAPSPLLSYAAESAAVWATSYSDFQRSLCGSGITSEQNYDDEQNYDPGLFWWAAKGRSKNIIGCDTHPWMEIALRSNAQAIRTGRSPEPVFAQAISLANQNNHRWVPNTSECPPGTDLNPFQDDIGYTRDVSEDAVQDIDDEICRACGTNRNYTSDQDYLSHQVCMACFYGWQECPNSEDGCGNLHPVVINNKWDRSADVQLQCYECGETASPNGLTEAFWNRYESRLDEIQRLIPNLN